MNRATLIQGLPKVDLHTHLAGTMSAETLRELADKAGLSVPDNVYQIESADDFLAKLNLVVDVLKGPDDFELITYEYLSRAARSSNLRHCELSFNPTLFPRQQYPDILAAIRRSAESARREFGISSLLIPSICRDQGAGVAEEFLDLVLAHRESDIAGIGLDGDELAAPPEQFVDVFRRAGQAGLKRTAHVTYPPASRVLYCVDELGCDRIDHGYYVLEDPKEAQTVADRQIPLTVCYSITCKSRGWNLESHPIGPMLAHDFNLSLGTDDEAFVATDIGNEYVKVCEGYDLSMEEVGALLHTGVTISWADEGRKAELHSEIDVALAAATAGSISNE
ncbi:hypothetical protein QM646_02575 [Rhodococcus erythropolis]|nr:hypothetical protein [Rhodococcus erythropolis]